MMLQIGGSKKRELSQTFAKIGKNLYFGEIYGDMQYASLTYEVDNHGY